MTARTFIASVAVLAATLPIYGSTGSAPATSVREDDGTFVVSAQFTVAGPAGIAREVLTDYPNIPRFMPDVRSSVVVDRRDGHVRVAQEAMPQFMWFSRQIFLVLDVDEGADVIRFRDCSNKSFVRYEGAWTIGAANDQTQLTYELIARPAFSVPGFVLRKLLKRDAVAMIGRLQAEIRARASAE